MPRSKSIPGSKPSRAKANKSQIDPVATNDPSVDSTPVSRTEGLLEEQVTVRGAAPTAAKTQAEAIQPETRVHVAASSGNGTAESRDLSELRGPGDTRKPEESRRFEVVKTESRKNVLPINLEDEIRRRAYELYEQRGAGAGSEADDWFAAEREVRQRYRQQSA